MKNMTKAITRFINTKKNEEANYDASRLTPLSWIECILNGLEEGYVCPACAGEKLKRVDSFANSRTVRCKRCKRCALIFSVSYYYSVIPLEDFHLKRGIESHQRPLDDLTMAQALVDCLCEDRWPSPAIAIDFGIDLPDHFRALQLAYTAGCNVYDLDRVMGDGPAITQLVHAVPDQCVFGIQFQTPYDDGLDFDQTE